MGGAAPWHKAPQHPPARREAATHAPWASSQQSGAEEMLPRPGQPARCHLGQGEQGQGRGRPRQGSGGGARRWGACRSLGAREAQEGRQMWLWAMPHVSQVWNVLLALCGQGSGAGSPRPAGRHELECHWGWWPVRGQRSSESAEGLGRHCDPSHGQLLPHDGRNPHGHGCGLEEPRPPVSTAPD